jgi:hypothetical protein
MAESLKGSKMIKKNPSSTRKDKCLTTITIQKGGDEPIKYCFWENSPTPKEKVYISETDKCIKHDKNKEITKYEYNNHMKSDNNVLAVKKVFSLMSNIKSRYFKPYTFDKFMKYHDYDESSELYNKVIDTIITILIERGYKFKSFKKFTLFRKFKNIYEEVQNMTIGTINCLIQKECSLEYPYVLDPPTSVIHGIASMIDSK